MNVGVKERGREREKEREMNIEIDQIKRGLVREKKLNFIVVMRGIRYEVVCVRER